MGLLFIWEREWFDLVAAECFSALAVEHFASRCKTLANHSVIVAPMLTWVKCQSNFVACAADGFLQSKATQQCMHVHVYIYAHMLVPVEFGVCG